MFSPKTSRRIFPRSARFLERSCTSFQRVRVALNSVILRRLTVPFIANPGPDSAAPVSPQGPVPNPFTFKMSEMKATPAPGGSVKIVDSHTFTVSTMTAVAEVSVEPGAMRELHWHPTQDEWSYIL